MTATELKTLEMLMHSEDTVDLGLDMLLNISHISREIGDTLEQVLCDWMDYYKSLGVYNTRYHPDMENLRHLIHKIDCVVRKPLKNKQLVTYPEKCQFKHRSQR